MTTSTIVWIVVVCARQFCYFAAITGWRARNAPNTGAAKRATSARRPSNKSHEVGQREALADETAAKTPAHASRGRGLMTAHSAGLQHQAQARRTDAGSSRSEVNREFERTDKIDPDAQPSDIAARGDDGGRQDPPRMPKVG